MTFATVFVLAASFAPQQPPRFPSEFAAPVRMKAGENHVRVESPGYAAPCWFDVDGDGNKDLVVGQFKEGRLSVYPGLGGGKLGAGRWLQAGGNDAVIPGVW